MATIIIFAVLMIVGAIIKNASNRKLDRKNPSPRVQRLIERVQAQQGGNQPTQFQGQFTQPASGQTFPGQQPSPQAQPTGRAQTSAQLAGMLQQLLQAGQQPAGRGQYPAPGQQAALAPGQYGGPVFQPPQQYPGSQPTPWPPPYQQPPQVNRLPHHRPPPHNLPAPKSDLEKRVRELMTTGNEVTAIRLLSDEQDLGIIEAQEYARGLVAPPGRPRPVDPERAESAPDPTEEETRYVGSAAFAESVFDLDRDENVWASGWVDKPEPEDRSDLDELWQTVRNNGRPPS
jgi:hypothetical protein